MDTFDRWFTRFMWGTDVVFLAASTPHIASWYEHFDYAGNPLSAFYAWVVGYGLAIAIDGVSLMLLFALTRMVRRGYRGGLTYAGIVFFMVLIAGLSWFINWQYDLTFASNAFARADQISVFGSMTLGSLNPIIGGAFSVLILAYAIISKVVKEEDKPGMSDEKFAAEKLRLQREQELNALRKNNTQGILARGKEAVMGQSQATDELLEKTLAYLRDARELLNVESEQRAIQALSAYLNAKAKTVLPLLIQARSIILREEREAHERRATSAQEQGQGPNLGDDSADEEEFKNESSSTDETDGESLLRGLQGRDTVSLETAAKVLDCQLKYIISLRNQGKLKHGPKRDDLITVASLRAYNASRRRRITQTSLPSDAKPSTNGYSTTQERETEKLARVSIAEDELVSQAQQN